MKEEKSSVALGGGNDFDVWKEASEQSESLSLILLSAQSISARSA